MRLGINYTDKEEFFTLYPAAHKEALNESNIKSGFGATGLVPYDPEQVFSRFNTQMYTPHEGTSTSLLSSQLPQENSNQNFQRRALKEEVRSKPRQAKHVISIGLQSIQNPWPKRKTQTSKTSINRSSRHEHKYDDADDDEFFNAGGLRNRKPWLPVDKNLPRGIRRASAVASLPPHLTESSRPKPSCIIVQINLLPGGSDCRGGAEEQNPESPIPKFLSYRKTMSQAPNPAMLQFPGVTTLPSP
ncbi:hypothetical protein ACJ73_03810 [Blastomyces percursus]|uniref:Uncharacterized protein n=1 Tax=Blastomyces percursus TaxID=1658174 RepID=A0A1J9RAY5_9EURO|nr:hypothetical protein ACJ73_03810 [Blastomyces percursus]